MNYKRALMLAAIVGVVAIGLVACASGPRGRGSGAREPGLPDLLAELSLFIPPGDLKGFADGMGGPGRGLPGAFTRDESLNLTTDQIAQVLTILTKLKDGGDLSGTRIVRAQKDIEAFLSAAQKKEYADFKAAMEKAMEKAMNEASAGPGGGPEGPGMGGPGDRPSMNGPDPRQIQSELDSFITALEDYQKQAAD